MFKPEFSSSYKGFFFYARGFNARGEGFKFHLARSYYVLQKYSGKCCRADAGEGTFCSLPWGAAPLFALWFFPLTTDTFFLTSSRQNSHQRPGHLHVWGAKHAQCASHLPPYHPPPGRRWVHRPLRSSQDPFCLFRCCQKTTMLNMCLCLI